MLGGVFGEERGGEGRCEDANLGWLRLGVTRPCVCCEKGGQKRRWHFARENFNVESAWPVLVPKIAHRFLFFSSSLLAEWLWMEGGVSEQFSHGFLSILTLMVVPGRWGKGRVRGQWRCCRELTVIAMKGEKEPGGMLKCGTRGATEGGVMH